MQEAFEARRLELREHAQNDDPDLVLVLETVGAVADFISAVQAIPGLEWLAGRDSEFTPDEDFFDTSDPEDTVGGKLFLVSSNRMALDEVVRLWRQWGDDEKVTLERGRGAWKEVFQHLRDVRFWGPEDRLESDLREAWAFRVAHGDARLSFEVEAWHYSSAARNAAATTEIRQLVAALGGEVREESVLPDIAYHAFLVEMPSAGVRRLLDGENALLLLSDRVMFFRPRGQAIAPPSEPGENLPSPAVAPDPVGGAPVVALLDGLPIANHPLLQGRLLIDDPDDWGRNYPAALRQHGTAMASMIVLGDLNAGEAPLTRPIYVRPVLQPSPAGSEESPSGRLLVDVFHSAVRRMFEEEAGQPAAAPSIRIINLSVGDEHRPFMGELSPWARLLDWLQYKYRVLFVISTGNRAHDVLVDSSPDVFEGLALRNRSAAATRALMASDTQRRMLAPAESVNALTVGATHDDRSAVGGVAGRFLIFADGSVAPYSGIGPGFRRAIKPDILMPGGRVLYRAHPQSPAGQAQLQPIRTKQPPGQRVASPPSPQGDTTHSRGTSFAAASCTRWGARAYEVIAALRAEHESLLPRYDSVLLKALLVHGASVEELKAGLLDGRPDVDRWDAKHRLLSRYAGLGFADVARALTCTEQRATLLGVGELKNEQALEFEVPLPPALNASLAVRRVTATLAWFTPVNARHSRYRVARLWVDFPDNPLLVARSQGEWRQLRLGTVHHEIFEGERAVPIVDGSTLRVRVNCLRDAGRIDEPIEFALCVSMEVAEEIALPIYQQIRQRIEQRVRVQP